MNNDFIYLAVGSNLGDRKKNFELAIDKLKENNVEFIEASPLYETPALLLIGSPSDWNIPYLNAIFKVKTDLLPQELLAVCKKIEKELGRDFSQKWSPRPIDLDILIYKNKMVNDSNLTIPHRAIFDRYFLLDELSFIYPEYLEKNKINYYTNEHQPVFMGILNITPNSFSGAENNIFDNFRNNFETFEKNNVYIIDIGAEATNPKVDSITDKQELERLKPIFEYLKNKQFSYFKPQLSIDTYHYETAKIAVENGFDIINDVNALKDEKMIELIQNNNVKYILTHSLTVPARKDITIEDNKNIVEELKIFLENKLNIFEKHNIKKQQIIFDIGIGFGKTASQCFQLLQNIKKFQNYGVKLLVGHSRKSFFKMLQNNSENLDIETMAITLGLAKNVDILRVHKPIENQQALLSYKHLENQWV